jgi:hypothetical protein
MRWTFRGEHELSGTPDPASFVFGPTPVEDGPTRTIAFTTEFCHIGHRPLTELKSVPPRSPAATSY